MTKVLQISADRSARGILHPGSTAFKRQQAYAAAFGHLDIIGFSLRSDDARTIETGPLQILPTNSASKLLFGLNALRTAKHLQKPDVVSTQDPFETGFVGWLIARRFGVPLHVQVHTDFLSPAYARNSLLNRLRVLLARFVLPRAQGIRVVSERVRDSLQKEFKSRRFGRDSDHASGLKTTPSVLPIFADLARLRGAGDPALTARFTRFATHLLVVARLEQEKNVELAISSFAKSAPEDACLIIVGQGKQRQQLESLTRHLGVSNRVFFEGGRDAAAYYASTDLVLMPSKYEGYGLVIIEALTAGKPVLSTDVGIAREAGAIVADPDQFAEVLKDWFKNGPRTSSLKDYPYRNFDEYVRAYTEDIIACAEGKKT